MSGSNIYEKNAEYTSLARWLQEVLQAPEQEEPSCMREDRAVQAESFLEHDHHLTFYQQLLPFVEALLANDPLASVRYSALLFHMVGCRVCHNTYLDLYEKNSAGNMTDIFQKEKVEDFSV